MSPGDRPAARCGYAARCCAVLAALIASSCGARASLEAPCIAAMEQEPVTVVVVLDHTATAFDRVLPGKRSRFEAQFAALRTTFDMLRGVASIGAVITNNNDSFVPASGCENLPPPVLLSRGTPFATISSTYQGISNWVPFRLARALDLALPEVRRETAPTAGRFLVFFTHGYYCEQDPAPVAHAAAEGVPTLVIGMPIALPRAGELADRTAAAGGFASLGGSQRFVDGYDTAAVGEAVTRAILPSYYCRGRLRRPAGTAGEPAVRTDGGDAIVHDPARRAGWDWRDPAQESIEVFGPACDDLVRRRAGVTATFALRCVE